MCNEWYFLLNTLGNNTLTPSLICVDSKELQTATLTKLSMVSEHKIVTSEKFRVTKDQGTKELTRLEITSSLYLITISNQLSSI